MVPIPFPPLAPVDLPALCAGSGIAQKRQKNAEGLGRRSAFFLGGAADRQGAGGKPGLKDGTKNKKGGFARRFLLLTVKYAIYLRELWDF